jgi:hypothetical protein
MTRVSHVGDDRLVTACLDGPSAAEEAHFAACEPCAARRRELTSLLEDVSLAADAHTQAAFTEERLASQRSKILQRLAHAGEPGRVIAFPSVAISATRLFKTRPSSRWVAAAAVAGLVIGLLVGRLSIPEQRRSPQPSLTAAARVDSTRGVFLPAAIRLSDDEFLGQVENAVNGPAAVLRSLHELTPTAEQFED